MKRLTFTLLISTLLFACKNSAKQGEKAHIESLKAAAFSDTAVISETIHGFYKWYNAFQSDSSKQVNFIDDSGKRLKINITEFKKYLAEFNKSGVVSEEFIINEYNFYIECELRWQREKKGDVPTGLDADKFYCAQDGEFDEFTTAPITSVVTGNTAKATMTFNPESVNGEDRRTFDLKKERGKWLLVNVDCEIGVK